MEPLLLKPPIHLPQEDQGLKIAAIGPLYDEEFMDQGIPCCLNSASSGHNKELQEDGNLLQTLDSASSQTSRIQRPNDASDIAIRQDFGHCDLGREIEGPKQQADGLWRRINKVSKVYGEAEISNGEEEPQWKEEVIMELDNVIAKRRRLVDRSEEVKKRQVGKLEMGDNLATSTSKNEGEDLTGGYGQLRIDHQDLQTEPEWHEKEWYADADELIQLQWVNGA